MGNFSHLDESGRAKMVDVTEKPDTERTALASAEVLLTDGIFEKIKNNEIGKGDVLTVAKIAGIQAAKKTYELIPLCHNIFISNVTLSLELNEAKKSVSITAETKTVSKTGVEMEALTAVSVAALTVFDMCKAISKSMVITDIKVLSKSGGKSGNYTHGK
ncbi:MAG: cyclic pyranopterin monophosphate synthase MoaC [Ignavibacteria bacterium]|jgi:molybdenum cofactor biosynthesis protein MoaC|nr:cyclic pyranopterin monophosphate synthase MoaC [Ignavibacteria bacterium]MCU7497689.1 cyclic pyranopterin monophosphate synthase MoaC [Ignavibacteria bacterium]MCU7511006.1 cyclic pyranopterin monophosphate synthase MoaC [Ignavibacteria bacterium]MCU7518860.1 cyclic pyranopterin monophosphate synthase MoaC [Ignavibacteria bacterium]MCU7523172.1 cyclic pyranopterin monophosphate synthase MoaC [Ignavibacteria bacterium]